MEELQARHRKEQRDLQSRITQKKKNATKKTRKGVNDECERLERELSDRQNAELNATNGDVLADDLQEQLQIDDEPSTTAAQTEHSASDTKKVTFDAAAKDGQEASQSQPSKKPNRQKARLARRAAEQEAQAVAAAEEAANLPDLREQEMTSMKTHMDNLGLTERYIRPDGHCLYSACAIGIPPEELKQSGPHTEGYQNIRYVTAEFISKHPDDFSPFLEEPMETYVKKIRDTAEWGGQLELQAIAKSFKVRINVLQSDGRIEKILPDSTDGADREVWLAYYRYSFGLGEHYNALLKASVN